jgi:phage baseplate assembly protein W
VNAAFPVAFDQGRTSGVDGVRHLRDMLELLLFTSPGERINRPDYGCGLLDLVFAPNAPELAAALQTTIQASVQRWLGDVLTVVDLEVLSEDANLEVTVSYVVNATGEQRTETFGGPS